MDKPKILVHLDTDAQPSVFDRVVAVDSGVDQVFSYGGVRPEQVRDLVYGAIFTRGPKHLNRTAVFIGGSDVTAAEGLLEEARKHLVPQFGLQVSMLLDANGANTTAAAAVGAIGRHLDYGRTKALVLAATGPVGQRVCRLLAGLGAGVRVGSRQEARARAVCEEIGRRVPGARVEPVSTGTGLRAAIRDSAAVVAAGAAGVMLLPQSIRVAAPGLRVVIDLNAVPPTGVEGVEATDRGTLRDGAHCYGALGVGDAKMKIHKAAVARLFERNDRVLDAEEVLALAQEIPDAP